MAFAKGSTILTTKGLKKVEDLENIQFDVILNNDIFPCHYGMVKTVKKDIYIFRTKSAFRIFTTLDQDLLDGNGQFRNVQDFDYVDNITLNSPNNIQFGGDPDAEKIQYQSSQEYKKFLRDLVKHSSEYYAPRTLLVKVPTGMRVPRVQEMVMRLGVYTRTWQRLNVYMRTQFALQQGNIEKFMHMINSDEPIPEHTPTQVPYLALHYSHSDFMYECEIEGAQAHPMQCFYVKDATKLDKSPFLI